MVRLHFNIGNMFTMKVTVTEESPTGEITQTSVSFDDKKNTRNEDEEDQTRSHGVHPGPTAICGLKALLCLFGGPRCAKRRDM